MSQGQDETPEIKSGFVSETVHECEKIRTALENANITDSEREILGKYTRPGMYDLERVSDPHTKAHLNVSMANREDMFLKDGSVESREKRELELLRQQMRVLENLRKKQTPATR